MTIVFPHYIGALLNWLFLLLGLGVCIWLASYIGKRDDGPPPDDMDEKPSFDGDASP